MAHSNPFLVDQSLAGDRQVDALLIQPKTYDKLKQQMIEIIIQLGVKDKKWKPEKNEITKKELIQEIHKKITFLKADKSPELSVNASLTRQIELLQTRDAQLTKDILSTQNENLVLGERVTELTEAEQLLTTEIKELKSDKDNSTETINNLIEEAIINEQKKTTLEVNMLKTQKELQETNHELGLRALKISNMETELKQLKVQNKKLYDENQLLKKPLEFLTVFSD